MIKLPVAAFLVEGHGHRLLVDTGMSNTKVAHEFHHPGSYQPEGYSIIEQLQKRNIPAESIDTVIYTHLHWDHSHYSKLFVGARRYVQRAEYEFATNPIPLYYKSYEHNIKGLDQQFSNIDFTLLDGETEIVDGISVYPTPGHCTGQQTVAISTKDGVYHCCGDAIFTYDNLKPIPDISYDITPPARFLDVVQCWTSIQELKRRAGSEKFILPTHEPRMDVLFKSGATLG
jgi:glyoxylase-like metal-dependent hydrolase (beta-lactamase superfamily II)